MYQNYGKDFDWAIELDGIDQFLIQDVKLPTATIGVVMHGAPGPIPNMGTPGKPVFGDLVLQKMTPAFEPEFKAWTWFAQALSGVPALFAKTGFLKERAPGFGATRRKYLIQEAWVKSIDTSNFRAQGEANIIETVTMQVWICYPVGSAEFERLFK